MVPMSSLFDHLNPRQIEAVQYTQGPSLILAGAGSGKTRVLTHKVLYLIQEKKIDPSNIAMMTFTNKAAREMAERVNHQLGFIGTFHSLCARILRHDAVHIEMGNDFVIYDDDDTEVLIKNILKSVTFHRKLTPSYVKYRISAAKDNMLSPKKLAAFSQSEQDEVIVDLYGQYQKKLEENNALDFDDLIVKTVWMFEKKQGVLDRYQETFTHILVDEFQDTNAAQYRLAKLLAQKYSRITVVGDFSQSIYSWRGADVRNLKKFEQDFSNTKVFHLEQNYRSTQNVLNFAFEIISGNDTHPILKLFTENEQGDDITIKQLTNEQEEALWIAEEVEKLCEFEGYHYDDIAILYRMNAQSRTIEEAFLHYSIPYVLIGGTRFYERKEIKDILAYLRLIVNPTDEVSLERVKKLGKGRFARFKELYEEIKEQKNEITTDQCIEYVFNKTGYLDLYEKDDPEDAPRLENLRELRSVALRFENLVEFLHQVALVESEYSENERLQKTKAGVRMMTLHQAKGLEFPVVFIIGVEEGILPHSRSLYDKYELEEERRLLYVGITRARKKLYITYVQRRFLFGRGGYGQVSRFIAYKVGMDQIWDS